MFKSTDCVLIMGTRGTGKSFLCQRLQSLWPRRIVFDALDEYSQGEHVYSFDDFAALLIEKDKSAQKEFLIVVKFDPEMEQTEHEIENMLRVAYYFGNVQIILEEVQFFSTVHRLPKWLKNCLLTGRHQNVSLMFTTQRPGELNKTILSQCNHIFCGRIVEGNDVRYVAGFLNQSADRLSSLPDRRFLYFSAGRVLEVQNTINRLR